MLSSSTCLCTPCHNSPLKALGRPSVKVSYQIKFSYLSLEKGVLQNIIPMN